MLENIRIILVEPQHPGNIGAGARAMKNMGCNDLWLVNPKRFPDPQADWRAAGATDLLEDSRLCSTLKEAVADCQLVIGTSARVRNIPRPSIFAKELPDLISRHPADLKVAILFGREDSGLTNDELQLCHYHLQIPSDEGYPVLNLAMALQIVVYELFISASGNQKKEAEWDRPIASSNEVEMMPHEEIVEAPALEPFTEKQLNDLFGEEMYIGETDWRGNKLSTKRDYSNKKKKR